LIFNGFQAWLSTKIEATLERIRRDVAVLERSLEAGADNFEEKDVRQLVRRKSHPGAQPGRFSAPLTLLALLLGSDIAAA
jgi:hypothetical protein